MRRGLIDCGLRQAASSLFTCGSGEGAVTGRGLVPRLCGLFWKVWSQWELTSLHVDTTDIADNCSTYPQEKSPPTKELVSIELCLPPSLHIHTIMFNYVLSTLYSIWPFVTTTTQL